ncbi:nicotinamidase/pyrazinamidase-like [Condylostylus longicornis]|uniref:nicotinamidase/pyrazinamidase-like n=1 Tax=Condylostylus longicornis TaxID=2530218 RepID=UPI00244DE08B|nr:nicotinamidase/pyrazinamidase-like [Condylostylus longicornis]
MKRSALLVVDVQNDFCEPEGSLAVPGSLKIIPIINQLKADNHYACVYLACDAHPPDHFSFASNHPGKAPFEKIEIDGTAFDLWPAHCVKGTQGAQFHPLLNVNERDVIIEKGTLRHRECYSAFGSQEEDTNILSDLKSRQIDSLDIVGLALDYCVKETARDAIQNGFSVRVIEDATAAVGNSLIVQSAKDTLTRLGVQFLLSSQLNEGS